MKRIAEFFAKIFEILQEHLPESELLELKGEFEEIREKERNGYRERVAKHRLKKCNGYENGNGYGNGYISETCENGSKTQISAENSAISTLKGGRGGFLINTCTSNPNSTVTSTISTKEKNKIKKEKCNGYSEELLKNFEAFWQAYPRCKRKTDKKGALKKFTQAFKADKSLTFEKVMKGLEFWKNDSSWLKFPVEDFIPAPEVWLNKCRWEALQNAPQPSEPARTIYAVPPAEEKRETISREEFVAILRGKNNGSRTAIQ